MKKFILVILVLAMVFGLFTLPCLAQEEKFLSKIDYMGVPGVVPRGESVQLFDIGPELLSMSTQIYRNISRFSPKAYLRTDEGLCVVNPWGEMTQSELEWVKEKSAEILGELSTTDEKIRAVSEYVAENVGYDYDYLFHSDQTEEDYKMLNHTAYDVLKNGSAVCYGYSAACYVLLQAANIPCLLIGSPNHAWNMAYNGERWVLFDSTWMSKSYYEYGTLHKSELIDEDWYDFSIAQANSNYNHLLDEADYCEYNGGIYEFPTYSKTLKRFTVPYWITTIGDFAFDRCEIPLSCDARPVHVGRAAFQGCRNLSGVVDLTRTESISQYAFYYCDSITGVILGDKLKSIPKVAFANCTDCKEIVFSENITEIGEYAFSGLSSLRRVYYGGSKSDWDKIGGDGNKADWSSRGIMTYNFTPSIDVKELESGEYKVNYNSILAGEKLVAAEYLAGKMVDMQIIPVQKSVKITPKSKEFDKIKIFAFDGYLTAYPKTMCVEINN